MQPVPRRGLRLFCQLTGYMLLGISLIGGCQIQVGGGGSYGNLDLQVPYYSQPDILLCGPTTVLMWRRGDGLSYIAPQTLGDMMGCPWRTQGCSIEQIVQGARTYTLGGYDAFQDDYGGLGDPDVLIAEYFSRQITSLSNGVPVIGLIYNATHAVIVHAGNYTTTSDGLKQWDYVYIQDPLWGSSYRRFVAGEWMDVNAFQVISSSAMAGWDGNFETYGDETLVRGWNEWPPEDNWPPEY